MTESTSEYKKRIEEIKQSIENEPYMAKMREDIAEGISKTGIRQATVEEQFQAVLDETTGKDVISAPELIAARNGELNLKTRLDKEKQQVTAQLAQTKKTEPKKYSIYGSQNKSPFVTFIDDDISIEVMTKLYPAFTSRNVPCNLSVITGRVDKSSPVENGSSGNMTTEDLKLVMNEGWELLGHGHNYETNLTEFTRSELIADTKTCKEFLESVGSFETGFVYPQSAHTGETRDIVNRNFDFSFSEYGFNDNIGINNMKIKRIAFGYSNAQNPSVVNGIARADTLEYYKACVDYAKETGSWLIFMLHAWDSNFNVNVLEDLLDYILESNITIGNASNGYKIFGLTGREKTVLKELEISPNSPIIDFPMGESILNLGGGQATENELPSGNPGTLITYRHGIEYYYNRQEYWTWLSQNERYYRYATSETEWSDWVRSTDHRFRNDVILNTNGPNLFPDESVTVDRISSSYAVGKGFPTEQEATIKTEKYTKGIGFNMWQTYVTTNGKHVYKRVMNSTTAWHNWSRANIGSLTTSERNSLPKTTGDCVYDSSLNKPVWVNSNNLWVDATGTPV